MKTFYDIIQILGVALAFPMALIFICVGGNIIAFFVALILPGDSIKETPIYWFYEEWKGKYEHRKAWQYQSQICRKCNQGEMQADGQVIWSEGSKYQFIEKFLKCTHCGRTISDQWPQYW